MIKLAILLVAAAALCSVSAAPKAAPGLVGAPLAYAAAPVAYAAPAPAVVTAHSSQYIAQNFHGIAAAPVVAAAAPVAYAAPAAYAAYPHPLLFK